MISIKQKLKNFNNLCESWNYGNQEDEILEKIDINFKEGTIDILFKKYCKFLEEIKASDYNIHIQKGPIKNKKLTREFIKLDLSNKSNVQHYINKIERQVDLFSLHKQFLESEKDCEDSYYSYMTLENIEDPFLAQYGMTYEEAQRELFY